jgi:AraC-like DNA-binding protein
MTADGSFVMAGEEWPVPEFETADDFIAALEGRDLLSDDPLVMAVLAGERPPTSARSMQRRVSTVTGLTASRIRRIVRARSAAEMLQRGVSILDVTHELGYADQAHLTRDLKHLTGFTPGQTRDRDEPI